MPKLYIGKRLPKGLRELPGAIHLGRGVWIIPYSDEPKREPKPKRRNERSTA